MKGKFKQLLSKYRSLVIGLIVVIFYLVAYREWFFNLAVLTSGDWSYYTKTAAETLRAHYFSIWLSDYSFGRVLFDVGQAPTYFLYGVFSELFGFSYAINERLIHMIPAIIISPIASYFFVRRVLKDKAGAFVGAIVYSFNTYFLDLQTGDITLATAYAIVPLVMHMFLRSIELPSIQNYIYSGLSLTLLGIYEPRVAYLALIMLFVYSIYDVVLKLHQKQSLVRVIHGSKSYVIPVLIYALTNFYWIYTFTKLGTSIGAGVIQNDLFGNEFFNISEGLTLFHPFWSGSKLVSFIVHPIPLFYWVIPLSAVFGLWHFRKNKNVVVFMIIGLIGVFLSKQSGLPFGASYLWLFKHFPGFNAYREASKFYLFTAISFSVLIPCAFIAVRRMTNNKIIISGAFVIAGLPFLYNSLPLINNTIGTTFSARQIPESYVALNKFLDQNEYYRTLWTPVFARWGFDSDLHPYISATAVAGADWKNIFDSSNLISTLTSAEQTSAIFQQNYSPLILSRAAVKYIVVPLRDQANDDDFFATSGDDRRVYVQTLEALSFLDKVETKLPGIDVFKNKNVTPYASAFTELYNIPDITNLSSVYSLWNKQINGSSFNFVIAGNPQSYTSDINVPTDKLVSDSNSMKLSQLKNTPNKNTTYFYDQNYSEIGYSIINGALAFTSNQNPIPYLNKQLQSNQIATIPIDRSKDYYVDDGDILSKVNTTNSQIQNLGSPQAGITEYTVERSNLVPKPTISDSLWSNTVENCNPYPGKADIGLISSFDNIKNKNVIELSADNHTACTGPGSIAVSPGNYLIQFSYRVEDNQHAGFQYKFNNSSKPVIIDIPASDGDWHTYSAVINVPTGVSAVDIKLEGGASERLGQIPHEFYDGLSLLHVTATNNIYSGLNEYSEAPLSVLSNTTEYKLASTSKNLIQNASLKTGLWHSSVSDCNAYNDKPALRMKRILSNNGGYSLELDAKNHVACTSPPDINIKAGNTYQISFAYQSPNSDRATYRITFDNSNNDSVTNSIQVSNTNWNNYSTTFTAPQGAKHARLTFLAYSDESNTVYTINRYKNFDLREIPNTSNRFYTLAAPQKKLIKPTSVTYKSVNSTKKIITISGAKTSFFLAISESYHPKWQLETNNDTESGLWAKLPFYKPIIVAADSHFQLNDFENGWFINLKDACTKQNTCTLNADGSYNMSLVMQFVPQRTFNLGLLISGFCLVAVVGTLVVLMYIRGYRKRNE